MRSLPPHRRLILVLCGGLILGAPVAGTALASGGLAPSTPGATRAARHASPTPEYLPGRVVYALRAPAALSRVLGIRVAGAVMGRAARPASEAPRLMRLPAGEAVAAAVARLRRDPRVAYAVPDYVAHLADAGSPASSAADPGATNTTTTTTATTPTSTTTTPTDPPVTPPATYVPNDVGRGHTPRGWEAVQWNFLPDAGVNAPAAWANLRAAGAPGARGVVVAVLDTGVAYRNWRRYRISPDFTRTRFVHPYDFVARNRYPLDREGHGTFVAGTIAESTDNRLGLTGLAYGASIMPIRVLNAQGDGDASTIAKGIRYAVDHGARVINLSLEFTPDVTASDIPEIISAIGYADRHGAVVVAAAGNEAVARIAYPARAASVISVGATTRDRCRADYSNTGHGLDLVAPGGGDDSALLSDPNCHPERNLPTIYQMTFTDPSHATRFGYPNGMFGTSMSTPHVAAAAAMVIASRVLGPHPTPGQVKARLENTAQALGGNRPNADYGYGLLDIGAATAKVLASGTQMQG